MASEKHCCSVPAVKSDYEAVGTLETIGDLPVYRVGEVCYSFIAISLSGTRAAN
jgi:hypothetical protein